MKRAIDINEADLLRQIRECPSDGLSAVLDRYGGSIRTICRNILGSANSSDIEECISDTLTELWRTAKNFNPQKGSLKSYIFGIARHKALDCSRNLSRINEVAMEDDFDIPLESDIAEEIAARESSTLIQHAVDKLPSPDREIFIQRYYLYKRVKEIAENLGLTPKTVENRLYRGKELLKKNLLEGGFTQS